MVGARVRLGPVSVTSKGRVGVRAGPVSLYAGGRGRRPRRSGGGGLIAFITIACLIALIVKFWYIALSVAIAVGLAAVLVRRRSARQARERERRWLAGPPPPLALPGRFTENWFGSHVPSMHPGQVPDLFEALRERGWTPERIEKRVTPYLKRNPYYSDGATA